MAANDARPPILEDDGRDERQASTTLDELQSLMRDGFRHMLSEAKATRSAIGVVQASVTDLSTRVHVIEDHLWGSSSRRPPPIAPTAPRPRLPSLTDTVKDADARLDELAGRLLAAEAEARAAKEAADAAKKAAETTAAINKQQSRAMGLSMPGAPMRERLARLLTSRKGLELMIGLVTAIAALSAALHSGKAPPPSSATSAPAAPLPPPAPPR